MAVTASLKFVQGLLVGTPGQALSGVVTGVAVVLSNGDNSGGASHWKYELLDVPRGSSLSIGTLSDSGSPTTSFTPDASGSYRVKLTVSGSGTATDTRNAIVPNSRGWLVPSFDAEDAELNYGGQNRGWAPGYWDIIADLEGVANTSDAATSLATADTLVLRDGSGGATFTNLTASSLTVTLPTLTYTPFIDLSQSGLMTVPSSSGNILIVPDAAVMPVNGTIVELFVPANHTTNTSSPLSSAWGAVGGTFDHTVDCLIYLEVDAFGRYGATIRVYPVADDAAPTILSASVDNGTPTHLVVTADEPITAKDGLSDILLDFTVGGMGINILSVTGLGTSTLTFVLDSAIAGTDVFSIEFAAGHSYQDLAGNALAPVTQPVTNNVLSGFPSLPGLVGEYDLQPANVVISSGVLAQTLKDVSVNGFDIFQSSALRQGDYLTSDSDFGGAPSVNLNKVDCFYEASALTTPTSSEFTLHIVLKFPFGSNAGGAWTFAGDLGSLAVFALGSGLFSIFNGGTHSTAYNVSSISPGIHEITLVFSTASGGTLSVYVDTVLGGSVTGVGVLTGGILAVLGSSSSQELNTKTAYLVVYDHAQSAPNLASAWAIMRAKGLGLTY